MMQTAQSRKSNNLAGRVGVRFFRTSSRSFLRQTKVRPVHMEITNVLVHKPFQVALVQHDDTIEQIPTATADEAFCDTVLPRASEAGSFGFNSEACDRLNNVIIEIVAAVEDQVFGRGVIRKRFAQLLRDPRAGWMAGYIEVQYAPPVMRDNEEAIPQAEGKGGQSEEVHCREWPRQDY
jgi:hypothetical protein